MLTFKSLAANHKVIALDTIDISSVSFKGFVANPQFQYYQGSITDFQLLRKCIKGVDVVIHLAAVSDGVAGAKDPALTQKINVDALRIFIKICKESGVSRFIFASTFGVYGNKYSEILTEDLPLNPVDPYSASKALGEEIVISSNDKSFTTSCLRIAMVHGISIITRYNFLVNNLASMARQNQALNIYGGSQRRPQIHVQDIADYFLYFALCRKNKIAGQVFNAVTENPSVKEMVDIIKKYCPELPVNYFPERENESSFMMSCGKLTRILKLTPAYTIADSIRPIIWER